MKQAVVDVTERIRERSAAAPVVSAEQGACTWL
jgi:hypothetical protein